MSTVFIHDGKRITNKCDYHFSPMKAPLRLIRHHGILVSTLSGALLFLSATGLFGKGLSFESTVIEDVVKPGVKSYPFEFPFQNTGERSIEIARIKTTCGCTTAKLDKMIYAPGETGVIKGTFSVGNRQGVQSQSIRVFTAGSGKPLCELLLTLEIPTILSFSPHLLFWRTGGEAESREISVQLHSFGGEYKLLSVRSSSPVFDVETFKSHDGSKQAYKIFVTPNGIDDSSRAKIAMDVGIGSEVFTTYYAHAVVR